MEFNLIKDLVYITYCEKGFYQEFENVKPYAYGMLAEIGLINTEVSEALEKVRKGDWQALAEELADIVIRAMNCASRFKINLEQAITDKDVDNQQRPEKHGNKVI